MKHSIYLFFILLAFLVSGATAVFAQAGEGSSMMIYNKAKPGTEENSVGNAFEQAFIKGLEEKYPCVDWMNEQVLFDEIEKLRKKEAETGELDAKALAELGDAVGATYITVVRVYTMGNGQTVVSVRVIDGKSAMTVADQVVQSAGGDAAYDAAKSVAQKILADLAGTFRGECDARWTGTITYVEETYKKKDETREMTKINKITINNTEDYEQKIEVALQPLAKGSRVNFFTNGYESMVMSRVFRRYFYHTEQHVTETGEEACRQRGANPIRKQFTSKDDKIFDEQGRNTETLPVEIKVFTDTGRFRVRLATPEVNLKRTDEHTGVRDFCVPQPFNENKTSERVITSSYVDFEGQIDPNNPNVIAGTQITGTMETRLYTITYNLHFVQPKKKRTTK